jgi:hypothetical protein
MLFESTSTESVFVIACIRICIIDMITCAVSKTTTGKTTSFGTQATMSGAIVLTFWKDEQRCLSHTGIKRWHFRQQNKRHDSAGKHGMCYGTARQESTDKRARRWVWWDKDWV